MIDLRPSAAHAWTNCPAYPRFSAMVPQQPEGDAAREGTCAAWVADTVLRGAEKTCADMIGKTHENAWIVTPDMAQMIQRYVDLVRSFGGEIHTERKVRLNSMIAGTPDAYAIYDERGDLYVIDLKYGYKIVEPFRNPQVSIYTGAIVRAIAARGRSIRNVTVGIYQPRAVHQLGPYRTWKVLPEVLMEFVHEIEVAGELCQDPNAPARSGEWCEYCPAAATCMAIAHSVYDHMAMIENQHQAHLSGDMLATELKFLDECEKIVKSRRDAIRSEAIARMRRGEHVPGWRVVQLPGDRKFKVPPETVRAVTGKNPVIEKPITPAALERMGVPTSVVNALSTKPLRPPTLKRVDGNYYQNLFKKGN